MYRHDVDLHAEVSQFQFDLAGQRLQGLFGIALFLVTGVVQQLQRRQLVHRQVLEQGLLFLTGCALAAGHLADRELRLDPGFGFGLAPHRIRLSNLLPLGLRPPSCKPVA